MIKYYACYDELKFWLQLRFPSICSIHEDLGLDDMRFVIYVARRFQPCIYHQILENFLVAPPCTRPEKTVETTVRHRLVLKLGFAWLWIKTQRFVLLRDRPHAGSILACYTLLNYFLSVCLDLGRACSNPGNVCCEINF